MARRWDQARHGFGLAIGSEAWGRTGRELLAATQALLPLARQTPDVDVIPFQRLARNLELQRYLGHGRAETFELLQLLPPMVREIGEARLQRRSSGVTPSKASVSSAAPPRKAVSHPVDLAVIEFLQKAGESFKLQDLHGRFGRSLVPDWFRKRMAALVKRGDLMRGAGGQYWHPSASRSRRS